VIKANELRIGNLLTHEQDYMNNMYPIDHWQVTSIGAKSFRCKGHSGKYFNPIPITEEWLLRLGYRYYNGKSSGTMCLDYGGKLYIDFHDRKIQIKSHYESYILYRSLHHVLYVHQLQNIYYSLTGQEIPTSPTSTKPELPK